ncbi:hypothetical protein BCR32DRAFT_296102 [Anaeromyces robustus]|jgi:hypothetical protein|uniref:CBM1 domain-containing protein n=1 Tax=Anaeromyces robustus TaxID=1754192 RepID=A0A1Y1WTF1_9FUNG|nr:hypothetical protein BCR32DRAFT_296102 [Anaeromyces robustus]|eukprot:ORX76665.1 hypothetical protein BCR32DRAFT_296102 [Anaeromyces robustus]
MNFRILIGFLGAIGLASAQSCKNAYTQCEGINYRGPKCCQPGLYCKRLNDYYYYCEYNGK